MLNLYLYGVLVLAAIALALALALVVAATDVTTRHASPVDADEGTGTSRAPSERPLEPPSALFTV